MTTIPPYLTRKYVESHPKILFVCATDRTQKHGASESGFLEGCRNVFWVPIKIKPCMDESAFFKDVLVEVFQDQLDIAREDFRQNFEPRFTIVIPNPTIAKSNWAGPLQERAPLCYDRLRAFLHAVETPHIIDWRMRPE